MDGPRDLSKLFQPESVALVGCEPLEAERVASWPLHNLLLHASPVRAWPVSIRHREIAGIPCHRSLADLPEVPDLALVMSGSSTVPDVLTEADRLGVGAAVVFGGVDQETRDWIRDFVTRSKVAVLGPNSNGICVVEQRVTCTAAPFAALPELLPGPVSVVSQSGALISSLVARLRRNGMGLRLSCSIGEAIDVSIGDFLRHVADDAGTETVLVYLEGLRDRDSFLSGVRTAVAAGKHVVVLKAGSSAVGKETVRHHTGGLVGSHAAFRALCEAEGVFVAGSVDELTSLPALLRSHSGAVPALGVVSGSGGIAALLADRLTAAGLAVPAVEPAVAERIQAAVGGAAHHNPVDLGLHDEQHNRAAIRALAADASIGALVYGAQAGPDEILGPVRAALIEVASAGIPVSVWSAEGRTAGESPDLKAAGIPVEPSIDVLVAGLRTVLLRDRDIMVERQAALDAWQPNRDRAAEAAALLRSAAPGGAVPGQQAWRLLAMYDIPHAPEYGAPTAEYATHLARYVLGYPVAMKLSHVDLAHRGRAGAVRLGLSEADAVRAAFDQLVDVRVRLDLPDAEVVVQKSADPAAELIMGARVDIETGPVVFIGTGGADAEAANRVSMAPAPVSPGIAARLVDAYRRTGGVALGETGAERLHLVLANLSAMAMDLAGDLDVVEMNPVLHRAADSRAVDVLVYRAPLA
ncbi:acetate--CoA ligase family protein [Micromonospora andamanensis]|uniref:acetate--CoA ligase family protein n=1 Tax=Micromonospora andamanensis TaxID=1287068 RepID=UPI003644C344